jgi:hypothetical protein
VSKGCGTQICKLGMECRWGYNTDKLGMKCKLVAGRQLGM